MQRECSWGERREPGFTDPGRRRGTAVPQSTLGTGLPAPAAASPCQHGVQQHPQAPDVTALVVALALQHLGTTKKKVFGSSLVAEEGLDLGAVHTQSFQSWTEQQSVGPRDQDSK